MFYTAIYQQQQTAYGAHLAYCRMGTVSHSTSFSTKIKKKEGYTYKLTPFFAHHDLFYCEPYILSARRVRRSLF